MQEKENTTASAEFNKGKSDYLWDENGDRPEDTEDAPLPVSDPDQTATDAEEIEENKKIRAQSFKLASEFGSIGLFLLIALLFSYYIGKWCDQAFGTKPIFTVFWICCGIAATILEAIKNIKKASKIGQTTGTKQ